MTLDKEEHRAMLLELINKAAFPGQFAEDVVELKRSIRDAIVQIPSTGDPWIDGDAPQ